MAIKVCFSFLVNTFSRLVVGTYPATGIVHQLLTGSATPDLAAGMIDGWDFDADARVLRVASAPGSAAPAQEIPLESLTRLVWGGREDGFHSGEYSEYDITLCYDDDGHNRVLSLPGSADYRCDSRTQVRDVEARLRVFLKPLCPRLETTGLEDLGTFLCNPVEALASIEGKVGRLVADMEDRAATQRAAAPDGQEPAPASDPSAPPVRELAAKLHEALGRIREAAARGHSLAGSPDHSPAALFQARTIFFVLCMGASALIGLWLLRG